MQVLRDSSLFLVPSSSSCVIARSVSRGETPKHALPESPIHLSFWKPRPEPPAIFPINHSASFFVISPFASSSFRVHLSMPGVYSQLHPLSRFVLSEVSPASEHTMLKRSQIQAQGAPETARPSCILLLLQFNAANALQKAAIALDSSTP